MLLDDAHRPPATYRTKLVRRKLPNEIETADVMALPEDATPAPEAPQPALPPPDDGREQSLRRWLRRAGIAITGTLTIMVGVLMLPLPGPGLPLMLAGLGILALEFAWAALLLKRIRALPQEATRIVDENGGRRTRRNIGVGLGKLWRAVTGRSESRRPR